MMRIGRTLSRAPSTLDCIGRRLGGSGAVGCVARMSAGAGGTLARGAGGGTESEGCVPGSVARELGNPNAVGGVLPALFGSVRGRAPFARGSGGSGSATGCGPLGGFERRAGDTELGRGGKNVSAGGSSRSLAGGGMRRPSDSMRGTVS
jgi:hypothetical protein